MSFRSLRQVAGLTPLPPTEVTALDATAVTVTPAHAPSSVVPVQKVTPASEVNAPVTSIGSIMVLSSTIVAPLLKVSVATMSAPEMSPPPSSVPWVLPYVVLAAASPFSSFFPYVSLDHLYTFSNADSLWGATYQLKQKTPIGYVSAFDKNLSPVSWGAEHYGFCEGLPLEKFDDSRGE